MRRKNDKILDAINKQAEKQPRTFWDYLILIVMLCTMGFVLLVLLAS